MNIGGAMKTISKPSIIFITLHLLKFIKVQKYNEFELFM